MSDTVGSAMLNGMADEANRLIHENESLRAENAALKAKLAAEEWRPIEGAPKDGTMIIGWPIGCLNQVWPIYESNGKWFTVEDSERCYPTHYRPLPQPPEVM